MWEKFSKLVLTNRLLVLALFFLLTTWMAWQAKHVKLAFNAVKVLPKTDSAYTKYNDFKDKFGEDGNIMVLGAPPDIFFKHQIFNDWQTLSSDIGHIKGIKQVLSIGKLLDLRKDTANHRFIFTPLSPAPVQNDIEMNHLRQQMHNIPFYNGLIFNDKNHTSLLAITFDNQILNSPKRVPIINTILEKSKAFSKKNNIKLHYSGLPYIRTVISKKIYDEFTLFSILSITVAALILFAFFRSFQAVFFPIILVIAGLIWSLGTLGILGYDITMLTGLIPPLIVIIGIPNSILLINKYHHEFRKEGNKLKAMQTSMERTAFTTLIANLTTATGFGVLYFTKSELLMQFGIVASLNIMGTWIICLCMIPIIFSYLPNPEAHHIKHLESKPMNAFLDRINWLVQTKRQWIYLITLGLIIIAVLGITYIQVNGYVVDDLPKKDSVYQDMSFFNKNFDGVLPLEVTIDTKRKNGIMNLSTIKKVDQMQNMVTTYPEFSRGISIVDILKFSSQAFYGGNPAFYRLPNDMDKSFVLSYMTSSGANQTMLKNLVDHNKQIIRVGFQMKDVGSSRMNQLIKELKPRIDSIFSPKKNQVELTGSSIIFIKGTNYLVKNLRDSLLLAIGLITLIMWVLFRGLKMILISLLPNLIPLIITAGIMGFCGVPLKPSTILIFSIAFGIASDQTIYFLTRYRHELRTTEWTITQIVSNTLKETGRSMIYIAFILFFGFGIFAASSFGGTAALGILISITLLMALIFNLTLLPAMLLSLEGYLNGRKN